jgi:hypothetical protein
MKMNKKLIALFLIISVLVLSMTLFACNKAENDPSNDTNLTPPETLNPTTYQIPTDLTINVEIYDGIELLGTAVNASFANIEQHKLRMDTINSYGTETSVVYIAYKLTDIVTALNITLPEINGVFAVASDNYTIEAENIDRAYITIGTEVNGAFVADADSPRYIADNLSTDSKLINKKIAKVVINDPLTTVNVNVELYETTTLLGTVTNAVLKKATRQEVSMTTVNSMGTETTVTYLGYKLSDIATKLKLTLPEIISVFARATDDYLVKATNIDNAYITIGTKVDGAFVVDADAPRYISDSTSTSSKSINKKLAKVIFNDPLSLVNVNVELYDNDTHLGTITNDTLEKVARQTITMTTVNKVGVETTTTYLAYKLTDIAAKLRDVTLPTITNVRSLASDNWAVDANNIDNAYITIGNIVDGDFVADADAPRYLSDSTSTESKSVNKNLVKIVFNYVG